MNIHDFPQEIKDKLMYYQEQQGNEKNINVFNKSRYTSKECGGFDWESTPEGHIFWRHVLDYEKFGMFFNKYPKKTYPKVMYVSQSSNFEERRKRVVFMEKNGKYIAWCNAETIQESEKCLSTTVWDYAKDIEEESVKELTIDDIAKLAGTTPDKIKIVK